jgi:uncharacterized protein YbjT (DUF2867 family)
MIFVVGATGLLGGEICHLLAKQGKPARALVRGSSDPGKVAHLRNLGIEIVQGDLKHAASLHAACRGATVVVSTASSMLSRQGGDSIDSVDRQGQLDLIDAAGKAGIRQFVLISFPDIDISFPLQSAKRIVEDRLQHGPMTYTILQPTCFMEIWLSAALGFDPAHGSARIYGTGHNKLSWISFFDVARFTVAAVGNPQVSNVTIKLGGPEALSQFEVVQMAEQLTGKAITVQNVPDDALRAQQAAAVDPLQQSMAALMRYCARGDAIEMSETLRTLRMPRLKSVREYLATIS